MIDYYRVTALLIYLAIGAFIAGWTQSKDAPTAAVITILYPLIPVMVFAAWLREVIHAARVRRDIPPAP